MKKSLTTLVLFAGIICQNLNSQTISINTDGTSGPELFNVGNTVTPPFRIRNTGQVLGWNTNSATTPAYAFVGSTNMGMYRPIADALGFVTTGVERIRIAPNGNTGINLGAINSAYSLEIGGSFGYGNGTNGGYKSRTESRDNAGLIASQSGFFETASPVNYPSGASSWWHLIDVRHSNPTNNYAMQLAGSFFDQRLYFRKTNNNAAQAWSEVLTIQSNNTLGAQQAWVLSGNLIHSPDDISGHATLTGDDNRVNHTLPFNFRMDGVDYNTITICTNGWISFGDPGANFTGNSALPSASFSAPTIFPYWDDLRTVSNNIRYVNVGSAPNRATIIDFEAQTYSGNYNVRFQVTIHEGSNLITVRYRDEMHHQANGQGATIGFQGAGGANAKAYPIIYNGKVLDDNNEDQSWSISPVR